jgi:hypothetical protein
VLGQPIELAIGSGDEAVDAGADENRRIHGRRNERLGGGLVTARDPAEP